MRTSMRLNGCSSLTLTLATEVCESRHRPQFLEQRIDLVAAAGHEQIDSLGADQNRAPQSPGFALTEQPLAQCRQIGERHKLIGGNIRDGGHSCANDW